METDTTNLRNNGMSGIDSGRTLHTVVFSECLAGLGIKVIGGIAEDDEDDRDFGIFIKKILPGGVAAVDGRLQEGDQLIDVNGEDLQHVTNEDAVDKLRQASASDYIQMVICRDQQTREEYLELLNNYSYSSASSQYEQVSSQLTDLPHGSKEMLGIPDGHVQSSRSITPTNHIRTPKSPVNVQGRLSDRVAGESSSASDMDFSSPRLRPNSSPPYALPAYTTADPSADFNYLATQSLPRIAKVPNSTAASMQQRGLLMAPSLASTPQQYAGRRRSHRHSRRNVVPLDHEGSMPNIKYTPPDGASGNTSYSQVMYEPSPVTALHSHMDRHTVLSTDNSGGASHYNSGYAYQDPPLTRKLSLEPHVRLPVEKLEVALRYLGLEPAPDQKAELRRRLVLDRNGTVSYGEFVRAARDVFRIELEQKGITASSFFLASPDFSRHVLHQSSPRSVVSVPDQYSYNLPVEQELDRVRRERDILAHEIQRMKELLKEKERVYNITEDELLRVRRESQSAIHESRALKTKVNLAEKAQKAARHMEADYAEVIRLLEKEIAQLKAKSMKTGDNPNLQKRLAVLGCQLRKTEVSKKTYEVATDKLLDFAQIVQDSLSAKAEPLHSKDVNREPQRIKTKKLTPQQLAVEARDTIKAVRSLLEVEPLPFGWEEAYMADGSRYFINHVTQTTMWHHPVSKVQTIDQQPSAPPSEYNVNSGSPNSTGSFNSNKSPKQSAAATSMNGNNVNHQAHSESSINGKSPRPSVEPHITVTKSNGVQNGGVRKDRLGTAAAGSTSKLHKDDTRSKSVSSHQKVKS